MQFDDIIAKYRSEAYSERDKGARFEELMVRYFMTDPTYASQLDWVKSWMNFPGRKDLGGRDTGIDLVAKSKIGEYWAIQCKCYAKDHRVSKEDMDTFIATSGRRFRDEDGKEQIFSLRVIVATTDNWGENAIEVTGDQSIPVTIISLTNLNEAAVRWDEIEEGAHGSTARKEKYTLKPHQQEAVDKAVEHYRHNDRGRMIMACGTGKTFTSLKIAEALLNNHVGKQPSCLLFLTPSIALVGQTLREWMANTSSDLNPICVCSDPSVSKRRTEDDIGERVEDLGIPATTDPERIAFQYKVSSKSTAIFSTYQSLDAVISAQQHGLPEFDLIICDEAHRTTGTILSKNDESNFTKVHDNDLVRGRKRLYMTATPRLYGVKGKEDAKKASVVLCSMDDPKIYGEEFYSITFGRAVELGLLSDYKVLILTVPEKDVPDIVKKHWVQEDGTIDVDARCKIWGCLNALEKNVAYDETLKTTDPSPMQSAVIFCHSIAASKIVTKTFNKMSHEPLSPIHLEVQHIDGRMKASDREQMMNWLKKGDENGGCRALSNVRCLSEGVDVPALDAVIFMGTKSSLIDVIQSVGRVMRQAPGKKYGYIIIPLVVPEDENPEDALNNNDNYKIVWDVLRALRSHDERLDAEINTFNMRKDNHNGHIHIARPYGFGGADDGGGDDILLGGGQYSLDDFGNALLARLVLKVGDRDYIENWAKNVAKVMPDLTAQLNKICMHEEYGYKQYQPAFNRYLRGLRFCVNNNVDEKTAIDMLAQQIVTKPIFEKLFASDGFVMQNSVSQTIDEMLKEIDAKDGLKEIDDQLSEFYHSVEMTLSQVNTADGKQQVIIALYEKFFKNAFPKDQAINGVVYTPMEIVDFIIHSAADALKTEFNIDINDENVNILDPFTGTGTFIARLMETGIINKENLERKYRHELFANEITLLAYYIATVNIENTFVRMSGKTEYVPFDNILLTDTFNLDYICNQTTEQQSLDDQETFKQNKTRIRREHNTPITVIIGNPPYGANQKSSNDNAQKRKYDEGIDKEIEDKYLDKSLFTDGIGLVNSVYDNYIRAFRWATDRIGNNNGIIGFVTPSGWLTGSAFEGFRKCIEREFEKIFVFNLRGDQNGGNWREEGEKIFGQGSKVGIAITLLLKRKDFKGKAQIEYFKTPDYAKRNQKLKLLVDNDSFGQMMVKKELRVLNPKSNGDWIIERNEAFQDLVPLAGDTHSKFDSHTEKTVFVGYSSGYKTNRDSWEYNYSKTQLSKNISRMISEYNRQTRDQCQTFDSTKIAWEMQLERFYKKRITAAFNSNNLTLSDYRPFACRWFYSDPMFINSTYQNNKFFPVPKIKDKLICVSGIGVKKDFSCLMTDKMTDLEIVGKSQCFPLYWYEDNSNVRIKNKQTSLLGEETEVRHDGISDYVLNMVRNKYGPDVTKEDIFYYTYGYLHSPDYRQAFANDLKLSLPRIGFVPERKDFDAFVKAGRELAGLHLNYEQIAPPTGVTVNGQADVHDILVNPDLCRVTKMKLLPAEGKLVYNQYLTVEHIPAEAFEYVVNGRTALGWLVDQYQYKVDKDSGIINDPNEFAGGPYILKLVLSIIGVSVKTVEIVKKLPYLEFTH